MSKKKILFVDDERYDILSLIEKLEAEGFEVLHFKTPDDAIQLLEQGFQPDLIISDLVMPSKISNSLLRDRYVGITFCQTVREQFHLKCPILVLTAVLSEEIHSDAKKYAGQLITKPVTPGYLVRTVREALGE